MGPGRGEHQVSEGQGLCTGPAVARLRRRGEAQSARPSTAEDEGRGCREAPQAPGRKRRGPAGRRRRNSRSASTLPAGSRTPPRTRSGRRRGALPATRRPVPVPILGGMKLLKLSPLHVEQCYAAMAEGIGRPEARGRFDPEVRGRDSVGRPTHAVRMKLIPHNPAADVAKAKPAGPGNDVHDRRQAKRFLTRREGTGTISAVRPAVGTGRGRGSCSAFSGPTSTSRRARWT